jgi:D-alanyl-D-alanine carboxypeptidase
MTRATVLAPLDTTGVQRALEAAIGDAVVGALIRVDDHHSGTWIATAGSAQAGRRVPVAAGGAFRIGSITKTFVATVVLQLVGDGAIGLDDPVQRHLPGVLPSGYPPIAVRDLLQHTSGVPNYLPEVLSGPDRILANRTRTWAPEQLVALATAHPRAFEPGTALGYSNTNYVLLGMLVRAVTGHWWGTEVHRRIARPLELTSTYAPGDDLTLPVPHARGYLTLISRGRRELVDITDYPMSVTDAAGSMTSTARDLNAFLGALLGGELLPATLLEQMLEPSDKGHLLGVAGWGLGILELPLPGCGGRPVYGDGGGIHGYVCLAFATRDAHRRVTVSLNTADNDPTSQTQTLIGIAEVAFCGGATAPGPTGKL